MKATWRQLEDHWKHAGYQQFFSSGIPVYTGVKVPGTLDCHWIPTELPLAQGKGWVAVVRIKKRTDVL